MGLNSGYLLKPFLLYRPATLSWKFEKRNSEFVVRSGEPIVDIAASVSGWAAAEFYSRVSMIQVIGTILFEIILGTYFNHSIKFRFRYGQISQSNLLTMG